MWFAPACCISASHLNPMWWWLIHILLLPEVALCANFGFWRTSNKMHFSRRSGEFPDHRSPLQPLSYFYPWSLVTWRSIILENWPDCTWTVESSWTRCAAKTERFQKVFVSLQKLWLGFYCCVDFRQSSSTKMSSTGILLKKEKKPTQLSHLYGHTFVSNTKEELCSSKK